MRFLKRVAGEFTICSLENNFMKMNETFCELIEISPDFSKVLEKE